MMFLVVMTTLWWSIGFKATEIAKVSTVHIQTISYEQQMMPYGSKRSIFRWEV